MYKFILVFLLTTVTHYAIAQRLDSTYAEKLGFPRGAKVLILHVDDAGMSFDSNQGAINAISKGAANSVSIMMPCPWVPAFIHYLKQHPEIDAGLHLTLTSEWPEYRWGPLAGKKTVPGLTDAEGALWPNVEDVVKHATADEVELEIIAQLDRARTMGFSPTHLDSHMGTLFASPAFLERYVRVGVRYKIPLMLPGGESYLIRQQMNLPDSQMQQLRMIGMMLWKQGLPVLDDLHNTSYGWKISEADKNNDKKLQQFKTQKYIESLKTLRPGLTMMIMHCTSPTEVFAHISGSGATRKGDMLAMMDPAFRQALKEQGIILTTWREVKERRQNMLH